MGIDGNLPNQQPMISASGTLQRITNDGGSDVNPAGIASLASALDGLYPSLALACSAGKVSVLFAHYSFKYGEAYRARVVADSGTVSFPNYVGVLARLQILDLFDSVSLIVPCDAGKASVLYGIDARGDTTGVLSEADAEAFDAESDYFIGDVPDIVAERNISGTEVRLNITNGGSTDAKYYRAETVLGNFASLVTVTPPSDYDHEDTTVDEFTDYKYKASFITTGTRNGSPRTVEGQRSTARYVIAVDSTL
jgi:hypothetical protein